MNAPIQPTRASQRAEQASAVPFYRFEAQLEFTPIGLVPEGLRMALSFEGEVVQGPLEGARVWGSDPLVIRPDGVGVLDVSKIISFAGVNFYEHVRGYCLPPDGLQTPALEVIAEPNFRFPDVRFPITGFSTFAAPPGRFQHLNRRLARIDGHSSFATGRLVIEARLLEALHVPELDSAKTPRLA